MCVAVVITNDISIHQLGIMTKSTGTRNLLHFSAIHRFYQVKEKKKNKTSVVTEDWMSLLKERKVALGYMISAEG